MSGETHLAPFHMAQEGFNSTAYYRCVVHVVMAIIITINIFITTTIIITIITLRGGVRGDTFQVSLRKKSLLPLMEI